MTKQKETVLSVKNLSKTFAGAGGHQVQALRNKLHHR